jgi:hypothetical protein
MRTERDLTVAQDADIAKEKSPSYIIIHEMGRMMVAAGSEGRVSTAVVSSPEQSFAPRTCPALRCFCRYRRSAFAAAGVPSAGWRRKRSTAKRSVWVVFWSLFQALWSSRIGGSGLTEDRSLVGHCQVRQ